MHEQYFFGRKGQAGHQSGINKHTDKIEMIHQVMAGIVRKRPLLEVVAADHPEQKNHIVALGADAVVHRLTAQVFPVSLAGIKHRQRLLAGF